MNGSEAASTGRIFMVAGEESGDRHGADLVRALLSRRPGLSFVGIGGRQMEAAGVEILWPSREISVVGIVEVLEKVPSIIKAYRKAKRGLRETAVSAAVLIDFPDFNLRVARAARSAGIPVFYYISPQVWAWRRRRVHLISRLVDLMLVILPFEEPFYKEHGVEAVCVGHPLVDEMQSLTGASLPPTGWEPQSPVIGLMPGSRRREVSAMFPHMLEAAEIIKGEIPGARFKLLLAGGTGEETVNKHLKNSSLQVEIIEGPDYRAMAGFNFVIASSGTATLEAGLLRIPMVIIYRGNFLSWLLSKPLINVPHIGLPNLIAGKRIVPEFRQYKATGERIARQALRVLKNGEEYMRVRDALERMAVQLGEGGASGRAAEAILSRLETVGGVGRDGTPCSGAS